jgi:hypothetical protein
MRGKRDLGRMRAVVPAYFHPALDPDAWQRLAQCADAVSVVVLNVADGPGERPDHRYWSVVQRLTRSGVTVAGYVDTAFGRRASDDILADIAAHRDWYGVDSVFLDQVTSGPEDVGFYARLAGRARGHGVRVIAFNHGVHPIEEYAEHADLLGTFEGPWRSYVEARAPAWVDARPAEQFFHLIYSVPRSRLADACALAARRRIGGLFVTDHGGANPWDYLPPALLPHLSRVT